MAKVAVIMGSKSDLPIVSDAIHILKEFNVEVVARVMSAHRTPDEAANFAKEAENRGFEVIIAAAGKAAHLPGVLAAYTTLPVIGLPIKSSTMDGLDSLLSIVQMPTGIPVATVAINGAKNAALMALEILALKYEDISEALKDYRIFMADKVKEQDKELQKAIIDV
ncbi:MAG TPA: 5-(carboxyamino)imidazole ribonucleotide mutase [Clostridiales bacterium]|nr:5-(carboxyamino)imidazole ribonucleotide mutase [Clostridiales bacterium]